MTRDEAIRIAKQNYQKHIKAHDVFLNGGRQYDAFEEFGFLFGWYYVDNFRFSYDQVVK